MKSFTLALLTFLALSITASAQHNLEFSGGYQHISGNEGLDGFRVGTAWYFHPKISLALDYDGGFDTSNLGTFELTNLGLVTVHSHLQSLLVGPRIFLPGLFKDKGNIKGHRLLPFVELEFGNSRLNSRITENSISGVQNASSTNTAFSWMMGGGADVRINTHWTGRVNADLLRTHFANEGQSRLRFGLGLAYTLGERVTK